MYRIQGPYGETPVATQQDEMKAENLNSTESFFVAQQGADHCWAWNGFGSSTGEKLFAARMSKILNCSSCDIIDEGTEDDGFWAALGGKTEYANQKVLNFAPGFDPRLFFFSIAGGYNNFKDLPNFV